MAPRRILLTGAEGFVGQHLLPTLKLRFPDAQIAAPPFDVEDAGAVRTAVRSIRPTACIHLAAVSTVASARRDADRAWSVNLQGTLRLAEAMRTEAPDGLLVFASSGDAYGASFRGGERLAEDAPLAPVNMYGATKAAADLALGAMAAEGLHVVRLRMFNQTGPGQSPDFVVAAFARQIARIAAGKQPPIMRVGDLSAVRDFIDVRDACAGYAACVAAAEALPRGTVVNLASGVPRRVRDVLDDLLAAAGVMPDVQVDPALVRVSDVPFACGNADKARLLLGWAPETPWPQTIAAVMEDWRGRV